MARNAGNERQRNNHSTHFTQLNGSSNSGNHHQNPGGGRSSFSLLNQISLISDASLRVHVYNKWLNLLKYLQTRYNYSLRDDSVFVWHWLNDQLHSKWTKSRIAAELYFSKYIHDQTFYVPMFKPVSETWKAHYFQYYQSLGLNKKRSHQLTKQHMQYFVMPLLKLAAMKNKLQLLATAV